MIIKSLDDLQVYQQALEVGDAITAILERPCWVQDPKLRGQLSECADRIPANISEGFGPRAQEAADCRWRVSGSVGALRADWQEDDPVDTALGEGGSDSSRMKTSAEDQRPICR
jgi:hypothetical protein